MEFFLVIDSVTENGCFSLKFLDGRAGKHGFVDAEKIWSYDAPNERIIDEEIIFFGKIRIIRKKQPDWDFRMMLLNPMDDAGIETLEINFRVTIAFEIFFERREKGFSEEGNIGISGGFKFDEKRNFGVY